MQIAVDFIVCPPTCLYYQRAGLVTCQFRYSSNRKHRDLRHEERSEALIITSRHLPARSKMDL